MATIIKLKARMAFKLNRWSLNQVLLYCSLRWTLYALQFILTTSLFVIHYIFWAVWNVNKPLLQCRCTQHHSVRVVPVTEVAYQWQGKNGAYFIYGNERHVHAPDYPHKCCCGCNILWDLSRLSAGCGKNYDHSCADVPLVYLPVCDKKYHRHLAGIVKDMSL